MLTTIASAFNIQQDIQSNTQNAPVHSLLGPLSPPCCFCLIPVSSVLVHSPKFHVRNWCSIEHLVSGNTCALLRAFTETLKSFSTIKYMLFLERVYHIFHCAGVQLHLLSRAQILDRSGSKFELTSGPLIPCLFSRVPQRVALGYGLVLAPASTQYWVPCGPLWELDRGNAGSHRAHGH